MSLDKNESKGTTALSLVLILGLAYSIDNIKIDNIKKKMNALESRVMKSESPVLQKRQVIGGSLPELFYEVEGHKVYLEIDGKPVESYFFTTNKNSPVEIR